ncbi:hypothetical protein B0T10DRAFT_527022 [Thelonectria olida]|uniref:Glycosyltransferase family 31 protein n=1 Tax=Thelonectria olida TaxID=1576542 RepID=A0A9P8WFE6_9HYPO|nr:hypothetical protein B0T10DRAFT_527022 [Thelonectria olida]
MPFCMPLRRRAVALAVTVITLFFLLNSDSALQLSFGFGEDKPDRPSLEYAPTCTPVIDHLRRPSYGLTREVIYQKRCIRAVLNNTVDRSEIAELSTPLVGQGQLLHLDRRCEGWQEPQCEPVTLNVPAAYPARDYSHMLFGAATSLERLIDSMSQFESWLGHSGAQLIAVITDGKHSSKTFNMVTKEFRQRGIDLTIVRPWNKKITQNEQHFAIVRDLLRHSTDNTKWVAIVDDDTFFPSLYPLDQILEKQDHTVPAYMGALSDNYDAVKFHGYMAFGGAGVFLSIGLLRKLDPHIEKCLTEEHVPQGDGLLKSCIYTKTSTKFTVIEGLHQLDMGHDLSGLYESGRLPISLHHWKSWHQAPVDEMVKISEFCGSCFMQRFKFGTDTVLSNGYSIAVYANGTKDINFAHTEGTWDGYPGFEWSLGPMREPFSRHQKKSYRLIESERVGEHLRQIFVHRVEDDLPDLGEQAAEGEVPVENQARLADMRDEVVELWWEF